MRVWMRQEKRVKNTRLFAIDLAAADESAPIVAHPTSFVNTTLNLGGPRPLSRLPLSFNKNIAERDVRLLQPLSLCTSCCPCHRRVKNAQGTRWRRTNSAYEQCGGTNWTGSTCCTEGYKCRVMGSGTCFSEVNSAK